MRGLAMENIQVYAQLFDMLCNSFDGAKLGKKAAQKMFYFFERKGIDLNLRYGIHYYGPYSAKLDNMLHILESEDYIEINTGSSTHVISMKDGVSIDVLSGEQKQIATTVIEEFAHKTPLALEALATMDFVSNTMKCSTKEQIISTFKEIKGDKFSESVIEESYKNLQELGLIDAA